VKLVVGAADVQMLIAAAMGLAGLLSLARRGRPRAAPGSDRHRLAAALLGLVALASAANYFLLGRHPKQFVKAWDVQHTWFGSKYAAELGYFRIYECLLVFDAQDAGGYRDVRVISDLRTPIARMPARAAGNRSDCQARFSPQRRAEFLRDLRFFQRLPERPDTATWFTDNGYNQSPFFTALTSPLFQRVAPGYPFLLALALVDVALELLPFLLLWGAFGARTTLLAAIFFFTSFSNQFAAMGGSILRFAYLALLLAAVAETQRARPRMAGVALGLATLFQVFPALYALGLALAGYRTANGGSDWALPFGSFYAATLIAASPRAAWWCRPRPGANSRRSWPCTARCSRSTGWASSSGSCSTGRSRRAAGSRSRTRSASCTSAMRSTWSARRRSCSPRCRSRRSCARSSSRSCS
jgi:hypothetical protein